MDILTRLLTIAPEFSSRSQNELQNYIAIASENVLYPYLTSVQRDNLIVYLAAHLATLALKRQGASGAVSNVVEGKLSLTYRTTPSNMKDTYDLTDYGQQYSALVKTYIIPQQRCYVGYRQR